MMTWTIEALSTIVGRNIAVRIPIRPVIQITHTSYKVCEKTHIGEFVIHGKIDPVELHMPKDIEKALLEAEKVVKNPS